MRTVRPFVLLLLLMRRITVTPVCRLRIVPGLTLKGGLNILFLTGSFYVAELPHVAGARELKELGGREGIGRIGMGLDEGEPVSRANTRSRD